MSLWVVVRAGGERWAIASDAVAEVLEEPAIEPMPGLPERVCGVLSHRDAWLPVLDLATALDLPRTEPPAPALILDRGRTAYALLVSQVEGTRDFSGAEGGPEAEEGRGEGATVREWTDDDGVITRLDLDELFETPAPAPVPRDAPTDDVAARTVVCFRLGEAEFGFRSDDVDRIWPYDAPERVEGLPDFVEGVLQVRGFTMPVLDLSRHLGLESLGDPADRRLLVLGEQDHRVGWIVDEVLAVAAFEAERWAPLPAFLEGRAARLVAAVVRRADRRPMLVLRAESLLDAEQRSVLQGSPEPA